MTEKAKKKAELPEGSSHRCDGCGQRYFRRDAIEVWDTRAPGRRLGWHKTRIKLCMVCSQQKTSMRILSIVAVKPEELK